MLNLRNFRKKTDTIIKIFAVIPVYEDHRSLKTLLENILTDGNLGYLDKVVVVSGSESSEIEWVVSGFKDSGFTIVLLTNPAKYTPNALNIGIEYSLGKGAEIIQMLGAHSSLNPGYFRNLSNIAVRENEVAIFSPGYDFFPPANIVEDAIQLFHLSRLGRNWQRIYHLPSPVPGFGSGAFAVRKEVFEKIGMFDERFIRNQDNEFFHRAVKAGFKGYSYPGLTYYYRTRRTLQQLRKQNFDYGRFFALDPVSHSPKQAAPFLFYTLLLILLLLTGVFNYFGEEKFALFTIGSFMLTLGTYLGAVMLEGFLRLVRNGKAAVMLPPILIMMHFHYAMGSFTGFLFGFDRFSDNKKAGS